MGLQPCPGPFACLGQGTHPTATRLDGSRWLTAAPLCGGVALANGHLLPQEVVPLRVAHSPRLADSELQDAKALPQVGYGLCSSKP